MTVEKIAAAMQVSEANPMVGIDGRTELLRALAGALRDSPQFFGADARPGNIVGTCARCDTAKLSYDVLMTRSDFLDAQSRSDGQSKVVPAAALWGALLDGLNSIWPSRLSLGGISLGDVWPCPSLGRASSGGEGSDLVPFHKLTGWLSYSLIEVVNKVLGWRVQGIEDMTGLPEYRNGAYQCSQ